VGSEAITYVFIKNIPRISRSSAGNLVISVFPQTRPKLVASVQFFVSPPPQPTIVSVLPFSVGPINGGTALTVEVLLHILCNDPSQIADFFLFDDQMLRVFFGSNSITIDLQNSRGDGSLLVGVTVPQVTTSRTVSVSIQELEEVFVQTTAVQTTPSPSSVITSTEGNMYVPAADRK
jgi:hypothetical protein